MLCSQRSFALCWPCTLRHNDLIEPPRTIGNLEKLAPFYCLQKTQIGVAINKAELNWRGKAARVQVREKDDRFQQRRLDTFFKAAPLTSPASNRDLEVSLFNQGLDIPKKVAQPMRSLSTRPLQGFSRDPKAPSRPK